MVTKMLQVGIIQPSQSSLSSLVVLVHKKDGSWHMRLDYRELNKLTIKDKFLFFFPWKIRNFISLRNYIL